jgi:GT2 family glycosyltransferase
MAKVMALIIDRNRPEETRRAVKSIKDQTYKDIGIRIWDNGKVNWGVAIPSNQFANTEECEYLFFLDNDAYLTTPDYISTLVKFMDDTKRAAVVFGRSTYPDGTDQWIRMLNVKGYLHGEMTGSFNGSGCLIRRRAYLEVGGYDPELFAYYLEPDLAARLYDSLWNVYIYNELSLVHEESKKSRVSRDVLYYMTRNHYLFHIRYMHWKYAIPQCSKWIIWSILHSKGDLITVARAHWYVLKNLNQQLLNRKPTRETLIVNQWKKILR